MIEEYRNRKAPLLFLVDRPGSGKTTLSHRIQEHLEEAGLSQASCLSDLSYIGQVFSTPYHEGSPYRRTADGGFLVLDNLVYEEALQYLADQTFLVRRASDIVIIEFARKEYSNAVRNLTEKGVKPDLVVGCKGPDRLVQSCSHGW
jgi:adenylate kinase family enzyme